MKKFAIALLALATSLAITPAAMASTLCSADSSAITAGTSCYEGIFTFTFDTVSIVGRDVYKRQSRNHPGRFSA